MRCWICSDEADSAEHLIKASDLRALFGNVSQKNPIYFHTKCDFHEGCSSELRPGS
jgi:hypothetical protein